MHCESTVPANACLGKSVRLFRLFAIALVGSIVMGVTSGGVYLSMSVDRYQTPLNFSSSAVRNNYLIAWVFCSIGLGVVALLCLWRRSRGHRAWHYGGALGLTFLAMMVVWFLPSFAMGFNSPKTGSTLLGNLGMGIGFWLLTSVYAMFFNAVNLLLVVPATIEAWYAVLNHDTPEQAPAGVARKRRGWLYCLTLVAVVLIGCAGL